MSTSPAKALVDRIAQDPILQAQAREDLVGTLREVEASVNREFPVARGWAVNAVWLIVVVTFSLVLLYSVWRIGEAMTTKTETGSVYLASPETMLTIVMTVVGFLAGLFSPSPLARTGQGD